MACRCYECFSLPMMYCIAKNLLENSTPLSHRTQTGISWKTSQNAKNTSATCVENAFPICIARVSIEYLSVMITTHWFVLPVRDKGPSVSYATNLSGVLAGRNCDSHLNLGSVFFQHKCCSYWQLCKRRLPFVARETHLAGRITFGVDQGGPLLQCVAGDKGGRFKVLVVYGSEWCHRWVPLGILVRFFQLRTQNLCCLHSGRLLHYRNWLV